MRTLLDQAALREALATLPSWEGDPAEIRRTVRLPTYRAGVDLVAAVAQVADELDHHPDVDIRWTDVTFRLSTHSAGGVTAMDVALARRIDELAGG